jgi:hypothetical protein
VREAAVGVEYLAGIGLQVFVLLVFELDQLCVLHNFFDLLVDAGLNV